ncbi:S1C family serine protease [Adhaeretor mobilis]|uniref:PDZ domain (Also known as DHR or GLGF) n=1 Tax=Adhaeretor mobilis TaxID=1930276 RepID=A0A517N2J1_9BACT|nr:PDZ domain-containing protein [Adhaeretor mobilis]QDT01352.1 PDZ domain (Also known as DHR or GLGF) [Adhaeretor mobilis]
MSQRTRLSTQQSPLVRILAIACTALTLVALVAWLPQEALLPQAHGESAVLDDESGDASEAIAAEIAEEAAEDSELELDGPIVPIGPDGRDAMREDALRKEPKREVVQPAFWIGIQGRAVESPVLRTHLQLADDLGVVIEQVIAGSPAEQAGLRPHDVIISAGGQPLLNMRGLQKLVIADGAKPIELKILRLAKEKTITVTPAERPDDVQLNNGSANRLPLNLQGDAGQLMREMLQRGGLGFPDRGGMQPFGMGGGMMALPGGVSISIQRNNNEPARITVQRGDEKWEVTGDDPESLQQLPEELRGPVERMLRGQARRDNRGGGGFDGGGFNGGLAEELEQEMEEFFRPRRGINIPEAPRNENEQRMLNRMRELEQRMQEMQRRLDQEDEAR